MIDFNDPEQRLDYLLHDGVDAYNKAMEDHFADGARQIAKTDLAISRPIVEIDCIDGSSESWEPQTAPHIIGTLVPVEEPSTASQAEVGPSQRFWPLWAMGAYLDRCGEQVSCYWER